MMDNIPTIALIGNPNCGKSTVFNQLTGLRQRTGNYPGVTVDIKEGEMVLKDGHSCRLIDFPGAYSLYPTSDDERLVASILSNPADPFYPDAVVYIAEPTNLEKHLLLLTQIIDLGFPVLMAINMADQAEKEQIIVDTALLSKSLGIPVHFISARTGLHFEKFKTEIEAIRPTPFSKKKQIYTLRKKEIEVAEAVGQNLGIKNYRQALLWAHHFTWLPFLDKESKSTLAAIVQDKNFITLKAQVEETLDRYEHFSPIVQKSVKRPPQGPISLTDKVDNVLTNRFLGPLIFALVMFMVFQSIFEWSSVPMDWIEASFLWANDWARTLLPDAWYTDLLTDGILAGLSGILVFVPQIAILFFLIGLLEEVGYMSRVVFMFDRLMQGFGMNGRSVVALISGGACAVPAIMSCRTIGNWKERLITILVTPFISCSARIPVYAILIALAVPAVRIGGIFSQQALVFGLMYLLGLIAALVSGFILKKVFRTADPSYLAIELPEYRVPHWKNVAFTVWDKVKAFVVEAGKVILVISMVLWAAANFGPGNSMETAEIRAKTEALSQKLDVKDTDNLIDAQRLENSYAGRLGKAIEPAIRPLGYDWKIGIALITSFAAREVFVGTMSTIYSLGGEGDDVGPLRAKMKAARFNDSGRPVYTLATAMSLLVFYALAMQCMSTMAIVKRETGSWKWPIIQFIFMGGLAYLLAWVAYRIFS